MTSLVILNNHKDDLKFLQSQSVENFCKLTWNFLSKGTNLKLYQAASQKLQVDMKQIQAGVEGLAYLFIEAATNELTEEGFKDAVLSLGLPEAFFTIIYEEFLSQREVLQSVLPQTGIQHPQYKDLEWRLEAQVSSKALRNQLKPRIIMKLDLDKAGTTESICLQSDIPTIIHINHLLQQALQESKTQHAKRIQRAVT